jgi:hypothetical protein
MQYLLLFHGNNGFERTSLLRHTYTGCLIYKSSNAYFYPCKRWAHGSSCSPSLINILQHKRVFKSKSVIQETYVLLEYFTPSLEERRSQLHRFESLKIGITYTAISNVVKIEYKHVDIARCSIQLPGPIRPNKDITEMPGSAPASFRIYYAAMP